MCRACTPGTYDHDGLPRTPCQSCPAETFQDQPKATSCKQAYKCQRGEQLAAGGELTPLADRRCEPCSLGTFKEEVGDATRCRIFSNCTAGEEETRPPSSIADRVCLQCPVGKFKGDGGQQSRCIPWDDCPNGQEQDDTRPPTTRTSK